MKLTQSTLVTAAGLAGLVAAAPTNESYALDKRATVQGFDISHYQGTVNCAGAYKSGARFVIIKVTRVGHTCQIGYVSDALRQPKAPPTRTLASATTTPARRMQV